MTVFVAPQLIARLPDVEVIVADKGYDSDFIQQRRSRNDEHRIFHEAGAGTARAAIERFDEGNA